MQELKVSTEVKVRIGPFLDVGDGFTPETGITLGSADEAELLKEDGAATVSIAAATWAAITSVDGWYDLTLTTSFTDTLGQLTVVVQDDSVCLPVYQHFQVVSAQYWDAKFGTGNFSADVLAISTDATAANNLEADYDGTGYNKLASTIKTCTDSATPTQVATALTDINLDHLLKVAVTDGDVIDNSVFASLVSKEATAGWDDYENTTDSLQAQTDQLVVVDSVVDDILSRSGDVILTGTADAGGSTTTLVDDERDETTTDAFLGSTLLLTSGSGIHQARTITGFTVGSPATITVNRAFTGTTPTAAAVTYEIHPAPGPTSEGWPVVSGQDGYAAVHATAKTGYALIDNSITKDKIAVGAIEADAFAAGAIDAAAIATNAITATKIAVGAIEADAFAAGAIDAAALNADAANEIATALLDLAAGVETGLTVRESLRLMAAALYGKASGLATTTAVYRDTGDGTDRISATVDADGNRSAVTLDAT